MQKKKLSLRNLAILSVLSSSSVLGQGFQVDEISARRLGDSFSGGAAEAKDASTAYFNPAGLVLLEKDQFIFGASNLSVDSQFNGQGISVNGTSGLPIQGQSNPQNSSDITPHFYAAFKSDDEITYGLSMVVPFASGSDFGKDFIGRYQTIKSELTGIRLAASLGFKLGERWSFGIGAGVERLDGTLESAVNSAAICSVAEPELVSFGFPSCAQMGYSPSGTTADDGNINIQGNDSATLYYLGFLYQWDKDSRLGMSYHSEVKHRLTGTVSYDFPAHTAGLLPSVSPSLYTHDAKGNLDITTPAFINLSAHHGLTENWSVQATVTWTDWSQFKEVRVKHEGPEDDILQTYNWDDSVRVAIGTEVKLGNWGAFRMGYAKDQSPIANENLTIGFPYTDWKAASVGFSLILSDSITLDLAYQKTFEFEATLTDGSLAEQAAVVSGKMKTEVESIALGLTWTL